MNSIVFNQRGIKIYSNRRSLWSCSELYYFYQGWTPDPSGQTMDDVYIEEKGQFLIDLEDLELEGGIDSLEPGTYWAE